MLVLFRKKSQRIYIGPNITITVCGFRDGGVRLGIEAPEDIPILRDDAGPKRSAEPTPETLTDVLPLLDVREGIKAEEDSLAEKHGGAEGPDHFDPIFDPRRKDV